MTSERTKGYVIGGAIGCVFAVVSAVIAANWNRDADESAAQDRQQRQDVRDLLTKVEVLTVKYDGILERYRSDIDKNAKAIEANSTRIEVVKQRVSACEARATSAVFTIPSRRYLPIYASINRIGAGA